MTGRTAGCFLPEESLDQLLPIHMQLCADARVCHAGPTLVKVAPQKDIVGISFFDLFDIERPRALARKKRLEEFVGERVRLRFKDGRGGTMKAAILPMADGSGFLVDLSFGISVISAVAEHGLTSADFAANDPAVEMLYLAEANSAAMSEARRLIGRLQEARDTAEDASMTDALTGLRNRRALSHEVAFRLRSAKHFDLFQVDLDYFKAVNDTHGHAAGDQVLKITSDRLLSAVRSQDFVSRVGGDEFVILLDRREAGVNLRRVAQRMISAIEEDIDFEGRTCKISASIGIVQTRMFAEPTLDAMMQAADEALYAAKEGGRGRAIMVKPDRPEPKPCKRAD